MRTCLCRFAGIRRAFSVSPSGSSIDIPEVAKFSAQSSQWWSDVAHGPFAGLHRMNAVRVPIIRRALCKDFSSRRGPVHPGAPLQGLELLDAGCGGGILSEALARLGASMTGLDASAGAVAAAAAHAALDPAVSSRTRYLCSSVEDLAASGVVFDGVVCSEVVEHVAHPLRFVGSLAALVRPGGHLVLTTINRTLPSLWGAVVAAEYLLKLVPPGTHEWGKFIKPAELAGALGAAGCSVELLVGLAYNPLSGQWSQTQDTSINYALVAKRGGAASGE
jgi:polyprenyldihydroxybenzoate methyltransferase/3-demethylubiquinol 3-O-methyltransferase